MPMTHWVLRLFLLGSLNALLAFSASPQAPVPHLPEFSYTDGWLGADDAYSIPLAPTKSLWLFGDTFVGSRETKLRSESKTMARNSIGISRCAANRPCVMDYYWQKRDSAQPRSFFDTGTDQLWYWPLDGILLGKTLYVSILAVRNKPGAGPADAFGFEIAGTKFATIDDAEVPPDKWKIAVRDLTDGRLWAGVSMVRDGEYVLWYTQLSAGEGKGFMVVMRVPLDKMADPSANWEYLRKDNQWVAGPVGDDALIIIDQPISEMSVRYHPSLKKWLALSAGPEFPSPRAVARMSDSSFGPWSAPQTVYEFPEMKRDYPSYDKDTFCYAVKEHVEFTDTKIALTYACNSMVVAKVMKNMDIYRPRVVLLDLPK
jgi:uncharacterized protein DUF4185